MLGTPRHECLHKPRVSRRSRVHAGPRLRHVADDRWAVGRHRRRSAEGRLSPHRHRALGVDYVDLLLIHWPNPEIALSETMPALAKVKRRGLARHIGVANFNVALLEQAIKLCPEPLAALQAEYHPYLCLLYTSPSPRD